MMISSWTPKLAVKRDISNNVHLSVLLIYTFLLNAPAFILKYF